MLIVESPGRAIVVDSCVGEPRQPLRGPSARRSSPSGWRPAATPARRRRALHPPALRPRGLEHHAGRRRWVPTFPNARYLFGRVEWEHWQRDRRRARHGWPNRCARCSTPAWPTWWSPTTASPTRSGSSPRRATRPATQSVRISSRRRGGGDHRRHDPPPDPDRRAPARASSPTSTPTGATAHAGSSSRALRRHARPGDRHPLPHALCGHARPGRRRLAPPRLTGALVSTPTSDEIRAFIEHHVELWNAGDKQRWLDALQAGAPGGISMEDPVGTPLKRGWQIMGDSWDASPNADWKLSIQKMIICAGEAAVVMLSRGHGRRPARGRRQHRDLPLRRRRLAPPAHVPPAARGLGVRGLDVDHGVVNLDGGHRQRSAWCSRWPSWGAMATD